jgi:hypothetical protein
VGECELFSSGVASQIPFIGQGLELHCGAYIDMVK